MNKFAYILPILCAIAFAEGGKSFAQGTWKAGDTPQDKVTATLNEGTLTISGKGKMKGYWYKTGLPYELEDEKPPWNDYRKAIDKVVIESGVTSIGTGAFSWMRNLRSVTIPSSVKSIERDAFASCANLTSIDIPNGVTSIGMYAFRNCDSLRSITIPSSVKSFGFTPFFKCKNLTSITILNPIPPLIDNDLFRGMKKSNCTLYVPKGSEVAYRSAEFWNYFENIKPIE